MSGVAKGLKVGTGVKNAPVHSHTHNKGNKVHPQHSGRVQKKSNNVVGGAATLSQPNQLLAGSNVEIPLIVSDTAQNPRTSKPPLEIAEPDVEADEGTPSMIKKSISTTNYHESHGERAGGGGGGRFIIKNLWDVCCNEIESEVKELDTILQKLGLPSVNYSKTKAYEITDYDYAPDMQQCKSKDFLDFYVFPYLLPAIQALIQFARVNRVFQCRFCTFNALDYIVEYLYNNNPRYPERFENPIPIFEIPFAKAWLEKHPRMPPPRWMLMSSEEAAIIIQRVVRGYMVRSQPEVQEMRQFWREFKNDLEEEKNAFPFGKILPAMLQQKPVTPTSAGPIFSPYYEEYRGEFEDSTCGSPCIRLQIPQEETPISPSISHHSDHCVYCQVFRKFLDSQPEEVLLSYKRPSTNDNIGDLNGESVRPSSAGNEEMGGSAEGLTTDNGGENEEVNSKGKTGRKESDQTGQQQHLTVMDPNLVSAASSRIKTHHKNPALSAQKSATVAKHSKEKKKKPTTNE